MAYMPDYSMSENAAAAYRNGEKPLSKWTKAAILERGWTKSMIAKLLPEPILVENPWYRSADPMKMWKVSDVEAAESTPEYAAAVEKAAARKAGARKAVQTKTDKLTDAAAAFLATVTVERMDLTALRVMAENRKYSQIESRGGDYLGADSETIDRWTVNMIRHEYTRYDDALYRNIGKVGTEQAHRIIKNGILDKIADVYPELRDACDHQKV